jgi:hypothetical protein
MAKYGSMSRLRPLNISRPADSRTTRDSIVKISYVGGCRVKITILPPVTPAVINRYWIVESLVHSVLDCTDRSVIFISA